MKKLLILPVLLAVTLLGSCLFEIDAQFNTYIPMEIPSLPFILPGTYGTNVVAETGIENMLQDLTGQYAEISALRLDYVLTNTSSNDVTIAIGMTGMSKVSNYSVQYTNYSSYHANPDQTAWIIPLMTLTQGEVTTGIFTSSGDNPLLRDLIIASNSYQLVVQTIVTNVNPLFANFTTNNISMYLGLRMGMTVQRAFSDVPGVVSLFQ